MIKVIKQGTRKTATCEKCGCVFSYEDEDIKIGIDLENSIKDACICFHRYVRCPQCNVEIEETW